MITRARCLAWLFPSISLISVLLGAPARADDSTAQLDEARAAIAALDYEEALTLLDSAAAAGNNGPAAMKDLYILLGQVHATLGRRSEAETDYRRLLALDPAAELPPGTSPKLAAPFSAAQTYMRSRGALAVSCAAAPGRPEVILTIDSDPLALVAGGRALVRESSSSEPAAPVEVRGKSPITLALPGHGQLAVVCAAIDEHGNQLFEVGSWEHPLEVTGKPRPKPKNPVDGKLDKPPVIQAQATGKPFYTYWYPWAGLTAVATTSAIYFAFKVRGDHDELDRLNAESGMHDISEAEKVARRGDLHALLTNMSLGVAGVAAVVTGITWYRQKRSAERAATAMTPVLLDGGAGVTLTTSF